MQIYALGCRLSALGDMCGFPLILSGHVLTAIITVIIIIVLAKSKQEVSAIYHGWEIFGPGSFMCRILRYTPPRPGLCTLYTPHSTLCLCLLFIYLFIYLLSYTYDMMLITGAGVLEGVLAALHFEMEKFADCLSTVNSGDNWPKRQRERLKLSRSRPDFEFPFQHPMFERIRKRRHIPETHALRGKKKPWRISVFDLLGKFMLNYCLNIV